ncbi:hypothetical protein BVC80_1729g30 [Macleaya cordata]|uniref:Uncharacterized protein n=1 Tax=Macleaya cordata TaxID=56857 RepID=A0A200QCB7_MACCD|nr:hypothetical protein BVC80_1729g30 [Macleaya cordata]
MAESTIPCQLENPRFLFKIWQKEETESVKHEGSMEGFVHFHFEICLRTKNQYWVVIRSERNGETTINLEQRGEKEEEEPTIVKRLCLNPRIFFEFPCTFRRKLFRLLSELNINIDPEAERVLIETISSFACKIAKEESNRGLNKLEMCVDIIEVF